LHTKIEREKREGNLIVAKEGSRGGIELSMNMFLLCKKLNMKHQQTITPPWRRQTLERKPHAQGEWW